MQDAGAVGNPGSPTSPIWDRVKPQTARPQQVTQFTQRLHTCMLLTCSYGGYEAQEAHASLTGCPVMTQPAQCTSRPPRGAAGTRTRCPSIEWRDTLFYLSQITSTQQSDDDRPVSNLQAVQAPTAFRITGGDCKLCMRSRNQPASSPTASSPFVSQRNWWLLHARAPAACRLERTT